MSGYLQRLFDRAGAAAAPVPPVTAAGRLGAPMAEADQRLMTPGVEAGDVPLTGWFGAEPAMPEGDLFDRPARTGQAAPPPAPQPKFAAEGPAPRAERPSPAVPDPVPPRIDIPTAPEPAVQAAPASPEIPAIEAPHPNPQATVTPAQVMQPIGELPIAPPMPDRRPAVPDVPAPAAEPAMRAVPDQPAPVVREIVRETPPAEPASRTLERETVIEVRETAPAPRPIPVAEPRPLRPAAEPAPEPDLLYLPEREAPEPAPREHTVERDRETVRTHTTERIERDGGAASGAQSATAPAHVTAASASVIGPLPDYQRAPMIRGRRRR